MATNEIKELLARYYDGLTTEEEEARLAQLLDDNGVRVGTGSACSSKNRYSRVILACGADEATADGVLRLSLSKATTEEECREAAAVVTRCARELRERMR